MPKVAAIQMNSTNNVDKNLATAKQLIKTAAASGAELIVLPEMFVFFGKHPGDIFQVVEVYQAGPIQKFLADCAKQYRVWIVAGTIPLSNPDDNNKHFAACLVFDHNGNIMGRYDKINLFDSKLSDDESYHESATVQAGKNLLVVKTPFGVLGIAVCFDMRFPGMFRELFDKGAEIIAIPAAFTYTTGKAHWEILARSLAIQTFSYIIGANQSGYHVNNRRTYGHSLIVNPWGEVLAKLKNADTGIIYAEIDLESLKKIRQSIPI